MPQHQFTNSVTSLLPPTVLKLQAYKDPVVQGDIKQNDVYEEKQDEHKQVPINDNFIPQERNLKENISDISSIESGMSDSKSNIFNISDISQDNGQHGSQDGGQDGSQHNRQHGSQDNGQDGGQDGSQDGGQHGSQDNRQDVSQGTGHDGGQDGSQHGGQDDRADIAPQTIKNKVAANKSNYLSSDDSISLSGLSNLSSITSGHLSLWSRNSSSSDCYNAQFYPEQYNYTHWGPYKHTVQNINTGTIHNIIRQIVKLKNSSKYGGFVFLIQINANSQMEIFSLLNNFKYVV